MAGNTVKITAVLDDKVSSNLDKIRDRFDRLGKNKGAQSILQGVGIGTGISAYKMLGSAAGTAADIIMSSIDAASDMNESMSKTSVVFGDSADAMVKWAETAAKSMGISKQAALEQSSTLGNLLLSMGKTSDEAAGMSQTLVQLAADLGSFNNVDPEEVLLAMRSGLTGEIAPLRRFGVNLSEVTLKAKGMELGLYKGKGVMDASAKSAAAYALILDQTTTAQGDFARTSDGMANQQKILAAKLEDTSAELGEVLIPYVIEAQEKLIKLADAFDDTGDAAKDNSDPIVNIGHLLHDLFKDADTDSKTFLGSMFDGLNDFQSKMYDFTAAFNDAWTFWDDHSSVIERQREKSYTMMAGILDRGADNMAKSFDKIGAASDDMADDIKVNTLDAAESFKLIQDAAITSANEMIDKAFDPIKIKYDLLASNAEVSAARRAAAAGGATAAETLALNEALRSQAEGLVEMARTGQQGSQVYKDAVKSLKLAVKTATGPTKVYLQGILDSIGNIKTEGRSVPINIIATTSLKGGYKGGARASGGPVSAGGAYTVGEEGPEMLVMGSSSGSIIPNGATVGVGGSSLTVNFNSVWPPTREQARDIARIVDETLYPQLQRAAPTAGRV